MKNHGVWTRLSKLCKNVKIWVNYFFKVGLWLVELQHMWCGLRSGGNRSRFNLVNTSMWGMQQHNYHSLYNIHLYTPGLSTHIHSPFCFVSLSVPHKEHSDWGLCYWHTSQKGWHFFFFFFFLCFSPLRPEGPLIRHSWLIFLKTYEK